MLTDDLDAHSEMLLSKVLNRDLEEQELVESDALLSNRKSQKESKMKRLSKENKSLRQQISKLKEIVSTDKILRQMKEEYNECVTECKQILQHLESKVQHTMLTEIMGASESAALIELLDQT